MPSLPPSLPPALTNGSLYFSEDTLIWHGLSLLVLLDDLLLLVDVLPGRKKGR